MKILLFTPPFCQLNTPYPGTAFLKSWLTEKGHSVRQVDGGLEVFLKLFCSDSLAGLFKQIESEREGKIFSDRAERILSLQDAYVGTVDSVIAFLQGKESTLATLLCRPGFLPEGDRFLSNPPEEEYFGPLGITDLARYRSTLFLEDLSDFITELYDPSFGFSRYNEQIALSPPSFTPLIEELGQIYNSPISDIHKALLKEKIDEFSPELIGFSIPFPGNLMQSLVGAKFIKENYPHIKITAGGGYANTELRSLSDPRVFDYFDYVTLDDGEEATAELCSFLEGKSDESKLIRTYLRKESEVIYLQGNQGPIHHKKRPAPDYSDIDFTSYLSLTDRQNPMHRLWSEGPWVKMMLAHGCYWKGCAFCDTSLDYIKRFSPASAEQLADQISLLIEQTGMRSFHFVDEAAPPALLKQLSMVLIKRNISITWWCNIRFEKQFDSSLATLMSRAGCIAVSGGLEVASDRLLEHMNKGVTLQQVSAITKAFSDHKIMVHAYLMYGFPGQNKQELSDALETVRQLFQNELIQSAFWHHFALTAHSPVGLNPGKYGVEITGPNHQGFARNDLEFTKESADLSQWGVGLERSLYNFMRGKGLEMDIRRWFDFKIPKPRQHKNFISKMISQPAMVELESHTEFFYSEALPQRKGNSLIFRGRDYQEELFVGENEAAFIIEFLKEAKVEKTPLIRVLELAQNYRLDGDTWFEGDSFREILHFGLIIL